MTSQDERQQLLEAIARIAKERGASVLSREQFSAATGISLNRIYQLFDGWRDACEQAGVSANIRNLPLDDATLFEDMRRVCVERGEICTRTKFAKLSKYSVDTLKKRYGAWPNILASFRAWLVEQNVEFPHLDSLPTGIPTATVPKAIDVSAPSTRTTYLAPAQPRRGPTHGAFLNFRGLQHAPINEQGVVFLSEWCATN